MKKILTYVLVAIAVVNIMLASATLIDIKLASGNKIISILLMFLYMLIATLDLGCLISKNKKNN